MRVWPLSVALVVAACSSESRQALPSPPPPPPVRPARDAAVVVDAVASYPGVITAGESVTVAPQASGVLKAVHVGVGDVVEIDQIVAEMDPAQMREELRAAEAAVTSAAAALTGAKVELEAAKRKLAIEIKAVENGVSPAQNIGAAQLDVKRAEAAILRARSAQTGELARAQTARDHLADTGLRAPIAGTIAMRFHDAGNRVEAGAPIVRIVGQGTLRLRFAVAPELARTLEVGAGVTAAVDTLARPITGTIKQISPTVDPASGLIIVDAVLAGEQTNELRPGLAASVHP